MILLYSAYLFQHLLLSRINKMKTSTGEAHRISNKISLKSNLDENPGYCAILELDE